MSDEMYYLDKKTGKKSDTWIWAEMLGESVEEMEKDLAEFAERRARRERLKAERESTKK